MATPNNLIYNLLRHYKTQIMLKTILLLPLFCWCAASPPTNLPAGAGWHDATMIRPGKDYALFIAVQDYDEWPKLGQPVADCEKIAAELQANYGFDPANIEILRNKSRVDILAAIDRAYDRNYADDAQLLIFFSGHGHWDERKCKGYFVPRDGKKADASGASFIDYQALQGDLASIPCRHILLAVDACFGGTFQAAIGCNKPKGDDNTERRQNSDERADFIRRTLTPESRLFFSSIGKETTSDNSRFARRWLEALQKAYDYRGLLPAADLRARLRTGKEVFSTFGGVQNEDAFVFVRNLASKDRDGDGVPDATDKCPDQYGTAANQGCRDNPPPDPGNDADLDGIPDDRDACPNRYGTTKANGCPDRDDDGVPDLSDECPDAPGRPNWAGCPDTDSDGLHDGEDQCPNQKGLRADHGCPPPDRDRDGVPDKSDVCPDVAGKAYLEGCPEKKPEMPEGLVFVPGGTFMMGSPANEKDRSDNETQHSVTVSSFYMGKYEVTQAEWVKIMGSNPSYFKNCDQCPVEQVSWDDVQEFLKKLNAQTGKKYRLPTEAEWEYAARGGAVAAATGQYFIYAGSNDIGQVAWYRENAGSKTHPVGGKKANQLGIFDLAGNVWEWCSDWYGTYPTAAETDPKGAATGEFRVLRGGSWYFNAQYCRAANRNYLEPTLRLNSIGFRLVLQ